MTNPSEFSQSHTSVLIPEYLALNFFLVVSFLSCRLPRSQLKPVNTTGLLSVEYKSSSSMKKRKQAIIQCITVTPKVIPPHYLFSPKLQ